MKKFVVLLVVVAISCFSATAFAVEISVSGSLDIRSRDLNDLNLTKDAAAVDAGNQRITQERVRLTVDAKVSDDVKGRISIENDWDTWGRLETKQANAQTDSPDSGQVFLQLREAWVNFNLPGIPVNVNVGHQLLQLGNGWFLRNMKYGDDAWVVANVTGANTVAFVDIKAFEGNSYNADDIDGYALLDVFKLSDTMAVGIDLSNVKDRDATIVGGNAAGAEKLNLYNVGLNFNGALGPVNLKAEVDFQMGKIDALPGFTPDEVKFKGNQIVIQGNVALDPVTINFTAARGSGLKEGDSDIKQMVTVLDADQHYTFLYEYKIATPALNVATAPATGTGDNLHTGFANTTALNIGVSFAATKSLNVGVDAWYLLATEDVTNGVGESTDKLGTEIDAHINWALYDNLSWNWELGYFIPGDAYKGFLGAGTGEDNATGIQGILSYKF